MPASSKRSKSDLAKSLSETFICIFGTGFGSGQKWPDSLREDLIEDVGEDAAGIVVIDFSGGIQADF